MAKLHEILAVEGDLDGKQEKIVEETVVNFTKKPEHYLEIATEKRMQAEADAGQNSSEHKPMLTTVTERLAWTARAVAKYWDVLSQKSCTNAIAKADIVVEGQVLAKDVPTTLLLTLEGKLKKLREVYLAIPTLDPNRAWERDSAAGAGIYKTPAIERKVTAKKIMHKVLYDATKEHPAQIEKWTEDAVVGTVTETRRSGMLTSAEKAELLERFDNLARAVKRARMRANEATLVKRKIGDLFFDYIHAGRIADVASGPAGATSSSS